MSLERKDESQLWRTSEGSGWLLRWVLGFVVVDEVGDVARYSKVVHREIAASSWFALHPDENSIVRTTPSACWFRAARLEAHSAFGCGVI